MRKVSIIGAGRLGSAVAYTIAQRGLADEIVLVDRNKDFACGHAEDVAHSVVFHGNTKLFQGEYADVCGSDAVVITCGMPIGERKQDRMELLGKNKALVEGISGKLKECAKGAVIITVSNPSDVMNYIVWKKTGFADKKIMGFGNFLDSARFRMILAERLGCKVPEIQRAFVVGEHGEAMVPLFSNVLVCGKKYNFSGEEKNDVTALLKRAAWKIVVLKGATVFGPASCITDTVGAILNDAKEVMPVSVVQDNVSLGVLARVGKDGATPVGMDMDEDEKRAFMAAKAKLISVASLK